MLTNSAKYKIGQRFNGFGEVTEIFCLGERGFQYSFRGHYVHERVLDENVELNKLKGVN